MAESKVKKNTKNASGISPKQSEGNKSNKAKATTVKTPVSLDAQIYTQAGKEAGTIALSEAVFGLKWNSDLVHQVITSMESSARSNVAHTKNRGDVSGGGKKPWQQKGTGRARHGSIRSPLWVGGGVTHGPRNDKDYGRKINKKMKAKALYTILSAKYKKGEILFVDDLSMKAIKTQDARNALGTLSKISGFNDLLSKRKNSAFIALDHKDTTTEKSFRNMGNVLVDEIRNINPLDLMKYKYVVVSNPEKGLPQISAKLSK